MNHQKPDQDVKIWAIAKRGPQIIDPSGELYEQISRNLHRSTRCSVVSLGRIVVESNELIIIEPRSINIDPKSILNYKTPEHIAINGLRNTFRYY